MVGLSLFTGFKLQVFLIILIGDPTIFISHFSKPWASGQDKSTDFKIIQDSCKDYGNEFRGQLSYMGVSKNCYCDPICADYGDCCQDSEYFINELQVGIDASSFRCSRLSYVLDRLALAHELELYLFISCPTTFTRRSKQARNIIAECEVNISTTLLDVSLSIYN